MILCLVWSTHRRLSPLDQGVPAYSRHIAEAPAAGLLPASPLVFWHSVHTDRERCANPDPSILTSVACRQDPPSSGKLMVGYETGPPVRAGKTPLP